MKKDKLFLIGGKDLEMQEIKKILEQKGEFIIDKNLSWGAKLSDYADEIENNKDKKIVGIELKKDIDISQKYIEIDHHNENSNKESSIEQIADFFKIKLNRYQKLVAENDKGYIPAMIKCGATKEEIEKIRSDDRKCQGVTSEDEKLAKKSIEENKKKIKGIVIIKSLTDKFSAITDRLFSEREIIVYNEKELNYYGENTYKLWETYSEEYQNKDKVEVYCGGGKNGYFGFICDNEKEIKKMVDKIVEKVLLKSYHVFMLPFKWDLSDKKDLSRSSFDERTDMKKIKKLLEKNKEEDSFWINKKFCPTESAGNYNEYVYFHEYTRKAIYNLEENDLKAGQDDKAISYYYEIDEEKLKDAKYYINLKGKEDPYELDISGVALRIFETGVGILSIHLENYKYTEEEDVLKINDFGRRIYPQFLSSGDKMTSAVKGNFLAEELSIKIKNEEKEIEIKDDFSNFDTTEGLRGNYKNISKVIMDLLNIDAKLFTDRAENNSKKKIVINPIIDDRMFVLCWYGNDKKIKYLDKNNYLNYINGFDRNKNEYKYMKSDFWYKYIFVDGKGKTCQSEIMTRELIEKSTYDRWANNGTLWGITPYSLVCLVDGGDFPRNIILPHLKTMYYQMAVLSLAQRASILRFSGEVSKISALNEEKKMVEDVRSLHKNYIQFVNRLYFREVTAQEQGIEIYDKIQEMMKIEKNIKDLDAEIDELHNYATLVSEKKNNELMNIIAVIGAIFVIPSFFTGFFGMNIFENIFKNYNIKEMFCYKWWVVPEIWGWLAVYGSFPILIGFFLWAVIKKRKKRKSFLWTLIPVLQIIIACYLNFKNK